MRRGAAGRTWRGSGPRESRAASSTVRGGARSSPAHPPRASSHRLSLRADGLRASIGWSATSFEVASLSGKRRPTHEVQHDPVRKQGLQQRLGDLMRGLLPSGAARASAREAQHDVLGVQLTQFAASAVRLDQRREDLDDPATHLDGPGGLFGTSLRSPAGSGSCFAAGSAHRAKRSDWLATLPSSSSARPCTSRSLSASSLSSTASRRNSAKALTVLRSTPWDRRASATMT